MHWYVTSSYWNEQSSWCRACTTILLPLTVSNSEACPRAKEKNINKCMNPNPNTSNTGHCFFFLRYIHGSVRYLSADQHFCVSVEAHQHIRDILFFWGVHIETDRRGKEGAYPHVLSPVGRPSKAAALFLLFSFCCFFFSFPLSVSFVFFLLSLSFLLPPIHIKGLVQSSFICTFIH